MAKKIKMRFVRSGGLYRAQRKNIFGCWSYYTYDIRVEGVKHCIPYCSFEKDELLELIVKDYYGLSMDRVEIIEFPETIEVI